MGLTFITQVLLILIAAPIWAHGICSSVYGAKPCPFIPSPPGETPPCAKPGLTYCEYPAHYPRELVYHLIESWKFDHKSLLIDESHREIGNYFLSSDSKYGFGSYGSTQNNIQPNEAYYPDLTYRQNPQTSYTPNNNYPSNTYIPSPINYTQYQQYNVPAQEGYKYPNNYAQNSNRYNEQQYYKSVTLADLNRHPLNPFIKWHGRNEKYYKRKRRSLNKLARWSNTSTNQTETRNRKKRQGNVSGQTLCQSRSQYIMPRAALNDKGDWMYVVNLPEVNNRYTQLVKSEICTSQQCNGLCSLPNGYTSKCEQKYVQKRLVAVEPGGSNLYSDVFWFPSCCVCTITNN